MKPYREIALGLEANAYMQKRMADGKTLAKYLLQRSDLSIGRVMTFVPPDVEVKKGELINFEHGQLLPEPPPETHMRQLEDDGSITRIVPIPNTNALLTQMIQGFLMKRSGHICIMEEGVFERSSPCVASFTVPWLASDEKLYYILTCTNSEDEIEQVIKKAHNFYPGLIGVMTSLPEGHHLALEAKKITPEELKLLAERAEKIILGAYDGEGYLIWSKSFSGNLV